MYCALYQSHQAARILVQKNPLYRSKLYLSGRNLAKLHKKKEKKKHSRLEES
jgi:hypothetical protein